MSASPDQRSGRRLGSATSSATRRDWQIQGAGRAVAWSSASPVACSDLNAPVWCHAVAARLRHKASRASKLDRARHCFAGSGVRPGPRRQDHASVTRQSTRRRCSDEQGACSAKIAALRRQQARASRFEAGLASRRAAAAAKELGSHRRHRRSAASALRVAPVAYRTRPARLDVHGGQQDRRACIDLLHLPGDYSRARSWLGREHCDCTHGHVVLPHIRVPSAAL